MKKKVLILITLLLLIVPTCTFAKEKKYVTTDLKETIESEGLTFEYPEYKETKDQVTIYLFRGNGCSYCKSFITYLNSIAPKYGKYFKLEAYEVWGNKNNSELMQEVGEFLEADAGGVPFIIIGDKVFPGYSEMMNQDIEKAIKEQYKSKDKYDVIEELEKEKKAEQRKEMFNAYGIPALFSLGFSIITAVILIVFTHLSNSKLKNQNIALQERISFTEQQVLELQDKVSKLNYNVPAKTEEKKHHEIKKHEKHNHNKNINKNT